MEIINYEPHCKISWFLKWGIIYINIFRFFSLRRIKFYKKRTFQSLSVSSLEIEDPRPSATSMLGTKRGRGLGSQYPISDNLFSIPTFSLQPSPQLLPDVSWCREYVLPSSENISLLFCWRGIRNTGDCRQQDMALWLLILKDSVCANFLDLLSILKCKLA